MTPESNTEQAGVTLTQPENENNVAPEASDQGLDYEKYLKRRKNRPRNLGIAAVALILLAVVAIAIYIGLQRDSAILGSDSYFLPENKEQQAFALFNKDGERLTDFIYSDYGDFVDGYALVSNSEKQSGIIDSHGKMKVDFGTYESISSVGGLYLAKNSGDTKLILGNGDLVEELPPLAYLASDRYSAFGVISLGENKYEVFNAKGHRLAEFESTSMPNVSGVGDLNKTIISYTGKIIILNNKEQSIEYETETNNSDVYSAAQVSKDGDTIVLSRMSDGSSSYIIRNKEYTDLSSECNRVVLLDSDNSAVATEQLYCSKNDGEYFIGDVEEVTKLKFGDYYIYDEHYYGQYLPEKSIFRFYKDGENVKSIRSDVAAFQAGKYFIVSNSENYNTTIYNYDGSEVLKISDPYASIEVIDEGIFLSREFTADGERIVVYDDGAENDDSDYESAYTINDKYLIAYDADGNSSVIDRDFNVIKQLSEVYSSVDYDEEMDVYVVRGGENKYEVFNSSFASILTSDSPIAIGNNHYTTEKDGKMIFYNRSGKEIHSYDL